MADSNSDNEISWGMIKGSTNKDRTFYSSFFSEGEEYFLYDNVETYDANKTEPHIGKIMKLWEEKSSGKKRMLIRWFLKPKELSWLNVDQNSKELFLAFGKGKGVTNENDLEVVCGKCKVLCTSKDPRNKQPSEDDLKSADYFFSRIYNVDRQQLSTVQGVADKLGCDVVFNKQGWLSGGIEDNSVNVPKANEENGKEFSLNKESPVLHANSVHGAGNHESDSAGVVSGTFLPESKKRPRDLEVVPEAQKKRLVQQTQKGTVPGALKRPKIESNEIIKNKKLKASENAKSTTPKDVPSKPVGTSVMAPDGSIKAVKLKEEVQSQEQVSKTEKPPQLGDKVQSKVQPSKTEKPVTPRETVSKSMGTSVISPDGSLKAVKPMEEVQSKVQPSKTEKPSLLRDTVQSEVKASGTEKASLPGDTIPKSPVTLSVSKSSPKSYKSADVLPITSEPAADDRNSNQVDRRSAGNVPRADGNNGKTTLKSVEVDSGRDSKVEIRKDSDILKTARDASCVVKEEDGGSGKKSKGGLARASETSRPVHTSSLKKEEEETRRGAKAEQEAKASDNKISKQMKTSDSFKSEKRKDNSTSTPRQHIAQVSTDKKAKEARLNAIKKMLKGAGGTEAENSPSVTAETARNDVTLEKRRIFKELPWEENLQQGLPYGKVLLVQNFDPLVTSMDVRDMMKSVFEGCSDARLMPQCNVSPYGQALVIFETKSFAEFALQEMERKSLVLTDSKRPLVASKANPSEGSRMLRFPGHLPLEKFKLSRSHQNEDMRRAVATSHCSQPNTIEFEMAMEWRHHQEIAEKCWDELCKQQRKEIDDIKRSKSKKA